MFTNEINFRFCFCIISSKMQFFAFFIFYSHLRFIMKRSFCDIDAVESIYILNHVCISIMANKGYNIDWSYELESRNLLLHFNIEY